MNIGRCPVCHSRMGVEQVCQDEAGRELIATLANLDTLTANALIAYVGLFRPASRDLANDRALKLVRETLQIEAIQWLTPALQETIESLREKRTKGETKPLANHNYLKRVLESVKARGEQYLPHSQPSLQSPLIDKWRDTSWAD